MICSACGEKNRDNARFCMFCGSSLAPTCSVCDTELIAGARFCDSCGTAVGATTGAEPAVAARKTVTVMFSDLTGSTALEERMDAESVRAILDRFYGVLRAETERHGGRLVKFTGDGAMSVFGVPDVREDDAARAIDAALAMRSECAHLATDLGLQIALKVGVNTGEVVVSEGDEDVVGDSVNVAARLEGAATANEILVGEETWRLTRGASRFEAVTPLELKGKTEPVPAYRLVSVDERTADSAAAPFVGRERELGRMLAVFEDAVATRSARLITIIGSPGLGKTRLARELMAELDEDARVRETRCDPADSTYAPIADALRGSAQLMDSASEAEVLEGLRGMIPEDDPDGERIAMRAAAILGVGVPGTTEETFWALRRLIEFAAQVAPVVLVFDDLHWAEPLLLDLIEHLAEWVKDAPVVLVGTGRPELRDLRPSFAEGGRAAAVIALEGLDESATAQLALNLLEADDLPRELLRKIPASTEGNPLFVREVVRMLVDDRVLLRTADGWQVTVDVDAIEVPPTIQSLLAARVDRLRADERTFIELAAVVGKEFYRGALYELAPEWMRDHLDGCLESLRRKELVEPAGTYWIDEPVYHFHHALIRDAAYRRVLKETRADLHARCAEWLTSKTRDVLGEHDEIIGFHLEQAHECKVQLGKDDTELAQRAAEMLGSAARRALDRDDLSAAASLSDRALARIGPDDPSRAEVLLVRCEALLSMGDVANGTAAVADLERASDTPRLAAWARCFRGQLDNLIAPERLSETQASVSAAARELLDLGDHAGAAKGHTVHAATLARLGRFGECEAVLDAGLNAARQAQDRRRMTAVLGSAPHAALWGPNPVSRAGGRCLDLIRLLRITTGSPAVESISNRCQAVLESFRGRADAARKMLRNSRRSLVELGLDHELLEADLFAGIIEIVSGDPAAATEFLEQAYDGFTAEGVDVLAAQAAALLSRAHLSLGEDSEAERFAAESERLAGQDLKASIAWRAVKAELLARRGDVGEARRLAEAAVDIASTTDALMDHADACRALAVVCAAAGDAAAAREASERAFALYERKGATAFLGTEPELPAPTTTDAEKSAALPIDRAQESYRVAFNAHDMDALGEVFAEDCVQEDRRTALGDMREGRARIVEMHRDTLRIGPRDVRFEVLDTRGDRASLARATYTGDAFEVALLRVAVVDEDGRYTRLVVFDEADRESANRELDRLASDAVSVVHRTQEAFRLAFNAHDLDAIGEVFETDCVLEDRRTGLSDALEGRARIVEYMRGVLKIGPRDVRFDVLDTHHDRLSLARATYTGDAFEVAMLRVVQANDDGRYVRVVVFDDTDVAGAKAEFERMAGASEATGTSDENLATRALRAGVDAIIARDWDRLTTLLAHSVHVEDARPGLGTTFADPDKVVDNFQIVVALGVEQIDVIPVATRGDRLALMRLTFRSADGDPLADVLTISEVDASGFATHSWTFDDEDAALAKLDERHQRSEPESAVVRKSRDQVDAMLARDWDRYRALFVPDATLDDHREGMAMSVRGIDRIIENFQLVLDLGVARIDIFPIAAHRDRLFVGRYVFRDNDDLSVEAWTVTEWDHAGLCVSLDGYGDEDSAMAGFEVRVRELESSTELDSPALRVCSELFAAIHAQDWERARGLCDANIVVEDDRSLTGASFANRDAFIEGVRVTVQLGFERFAIEPLAVRGDRVAMIRIVAAANEFDLVTYAVGEIDDTSSIVGAWVYGELRPATVKLEERYIAGEGAEFRAALERGLAIALVTIDADIDAAAAILAPDVVMVDHRPNAWGERRGVAAWLEVFASAVNSVGSRHAWVSRFLELGSDVTLAVGRIGIYDDKGDWLDQSRLVLAVGHDALIDRIEYFPLDQLEEARARYFELTRPLADSSAISENTSSQQLRAMMEAFEQGDWDRFRSTWSADATTYDLRSGLNSTMHGINEITGNWKVAADLGADRVGVRLLATRGDRLSLTAVQIVVSGASMDLDYYAVMVVDGSGRCIQGWGYDNLNEAFDRIDELYVTGEGAQFAIEFSETADAARAYAERDWERFASSTTDDCVMVDHRPASMGHLMKDEHLANVKGLVDVIPDLVLRIAEVYAIAPGRLLYRVNGKGTNTSGGDVAVDFIVCSALRGGKPYRVEYFALDQLSDAREAFDATPANACTRAIDRFLTLLNDGEVDEACRMNHRDIVLDDRRPGLGSRVEGDEDVLDNLRLAISFGPTIAWSHVAVRGERLAIVRQHWSGDRPSPFEADLLTVFEIDEDGLFIDVIHVDPTDEAAAHAEMEGRHARAAPHSNRTTAAAFRFFDLVNRGEIDMAMRLLSPEFVTDDRQRGVRNRLEGAEALRNLRDALREGKPRLSYTPLAVRGERLALGRQRWEGTSPIEWDVEFLTVTELDAEGRSAVVVQFDEDMYDAALAELEARALHVGRRLSNRSAVASHRMFDLVARGKVDEAMAMSRPDVVFDDRRSGLQSRVTGDEASANLREAFVASPQVVLAVHATRGETLVLTTQTWSLRNGFEVEYLAIVECDRDGDFVAVVMFDAEEVDAAYAELDARFIASLEGPRRAVYESMVHDVDIINRSAWDEMRMRAAGTIVDRRRSSLGESVSQEDLITSMRTLREMVPDAKVRIREVVALEAHGCVLDAPTIGTSVDGAMVELDNVALNWFEGGRAQRAEFFDVDDRDAAIARFAELAGPTSELANRCTRQVDELFAAFDRRDLDAFLELHSDEFIHEDDRTGIRHVTRGKDAVRELVTTHWELGGGGTRVETIAVRGDRLSLRQRTYLSADGDDDDVYEQPQLIVDEIDEQGRAWKVKVFDPDDLGAAIAELEGRFVGGEGAAYADMVVRGVAFMRALNALDLNAIEPLLSEQCTFVDHRPASFGELSGNEYLSSLAVMRDLIEDFRYVVRRYLALETSVALSEIDTRIRTTDGNDIEQRFLGLAVEVDGRWQRIEMFDLEQLELARTRFEELRSETSTPDSDDLNVPANAFERFWAISSQIYDEGAWERLPEILTEDVLLDDRRIGVGSQGRGITAYRRNWSTMRDLGMRFGANEVLAVRGDRAFLARSSMADADGNEFVALSVGEFDDEGRVVSIAFLDEDALADAYEDLDERYAATLDPDRADVIHVQARSLRHWNAQDWDALSQTLAPDVVFVDHQPVTLGEVEGRDRLLPTIRETVEIVPDTQHWVSRFHEIAPGRALLEIHRTGTNSGGGLTEARYLQVVTIGNGMFHRMERFPLDQLPAARARFAELVAAVDSDPPLENVAARTALAVSEAALVLDWDRYRSLLATDIVVDERRPLSTGIRHGVDAQVENMQAVLAVGVERIKRTVLAIRGERLVLEHVSFTGAAFETDVIIVTEANDAGSIIAFVLFDPDDIDSAYEELEERFAQGEGADGAAIVRLLARAITAWNGHDWELYGSLVAPHVQYIDHRPLGLGANGREGLVVVVRSLADLIPDVRHEVVRFHAVSHDVAFFEMSVHGHDHEGGAVELAYLHVFQLEDGLCSLAERFPVESFDAALARFQELADRSPGSR